VTERFKREFSTAMAVRPWQIRASALDGAHTPGGGRNRRSRSKICCERVSSGRRLWFDSAEAWLAAPRVDTRRARVGP
jgi:hypothetical protein